MDKRTVAEIIELKGGATVIGAALDLPSTTISSWKNRGRVPVDHWPRFVALPVPAGENQTSYEELVALHASEDAGAAA